MTPEGSEAPVNVPPMEVRDMPTVYGLTRTSIVPTFPERNAPPTHKLERKNIPQHPNTSFSATMPNEFMIPSFTGTTAFEAMRYEKPFVVRLWSSFWQNNSILIASGIAYHTLISLIPLFAFAFVVLSQMFDTELLVQTLASNAEHLVPGNMTAIESQLTYFVVHRELFGGVTLILLLFTSRIAFLTLESAMAVVFAYDKTHSKRRFWVSITITYVYIACIFIGLLLLTGVSSLLSRSSNGTINFLGLSWSLHLNSSIFLHTLSYIGLGLMLSSFYMILPRCPISHKRALLGGFVAAAIWEIVRHGLIYFFSEYYVFSQIYGALGTVIVILLCLQIAAIIILLGAQIIAELQREELYLTLKGELGSGESA